MKRLLTAAAVAVLLASPAMAQSTSPSERSDSTVQGSGSTTSPGSSSSGSMSPGSPGSTGLSGQAPADCLPNDPRPACQTAQLPGQDPSGSSGSAGSQMERESSPPGSSSGSMGSGSSGMGSGSSGTGSSGTTGR